jgi:hypothetical protein
MAALLLQVNRNRVDDDQPRSRRTTASTDVGATRLLDPADDPEVRQRVDDAVEMARARARRGSRAIRPPRIASSLLRESQHAGSGSATPAARLLLSCFNIRAPG